MKPIYNQIETIILNNLSKGEITIVGKSVTYIRRPRIWSVPNLLNSHGILTQYIKDEPLAKIQDNTHIQVINRGIKQLGGRINRQLKDETSR